VRVITRDNAAYQQKTSVSKCKKIYKYLRIMRLDIFLVLER
jgi:hypothetical protein